MIPCISIDGVDGSGKTTLIQNLSKQYNVITLPRFYSMGMVPGDQEERCQWFRKQDAVYTTPIYIYPVTDSDSISRQNSKRDFIIKLSKMLRI